MRTDKRGENMVINTKKDKIENAELNKLINKKWGTKKRSTWKE